MPKTRIVDTYTISSSGGAKIYDLAEEVDLYHIKTAGTTTLTGDMEFLTTGTAYEGMEFDILYTGGLVTNINSGINLIFFGTYLTDEEAYTKLRIRAIYVNGTWSVGLFPYSIYSQPSLWGSQIKDGTMGANAFLNGKFPIAKLAALIGEGYMLLGGVDGAISQIDAKGSGKLLIGNGTSVASKSVTGVISIDEDGVTQLTNDSVTSDKVENGAISTSKLDTWLKYEMMSVDVSFETGEQGTNKIKMPYGGTLVEIYGIVTHEIAHNNSGTVTPKNNAGTTMTGGTLTFAALDAINTAYTTTPSANNTFVAGDILTFLTAKADAGGKVKLSLKILRS